MINNFYSDIPELLKEYLYYMENIQNRSLATINEYYYDLRNAFKFLKREKLNLKIDNLDEIDIIDLDLDFIKTIAQNDLLEYLHYLSNVQLDKANTRARKISSIKSFFNYICVKQKKLDVNPCAGLENPKIGKRLPRYLSLDEAVSLLHSVDGKFKKRDYAILTLFLNCGFRLSELVGINISHIRSNTITVLGKGNKERSIFLNDACMSAINEYLKERPKDGVIDKDALFLSSRKTRIGRRTVEVIVKKYIIQAGLDPNKYSPHKLRHTAATLMHKHGNVDIRALQQILGHESISTTEIYTHIDSEEVKNALNSNPLNRKNI